MAENGPSRIVAMLHVTPTEEGGRRTDGYLSASRMATEGLNDAPLKLEGLTALAPGQSVSIKQRLNR